MLQTHDLACVRGDRRLFRGLNLSLDSGQLLRVEGANGSGKTSLLRLLAGLGLPAAGEVRWQGRPIRRQREAYAQALLYLGHLGGLKDELTPVENLQIEAGLSGLGRVDDAAIGDALAQWGLVRQARLPLRVLSAGQKRRAALARLSLSTARLWILDEPFNALDVDAVALLGRRLDAHVAGGGLAVVTSHMPLPVAPAQLQTLRLG
jgi:heme exporter protein A